MVSNLIYQTDPVYPPLAKQARVQGSVVLEVVINKEGSVETTRVLSGHPLLAQAAVEAVRQWRYRPVTLNGETREVVTTVTVNFKLPQ
jgi:periplasmic protein TonB